MRKQTRHSNYIVALTLCGLLAGCFGSSSDSPKSNGNGNGTSGNGVKVENPAGDTSVSAEDGGPGFTGEGWTTVATGPLGDPNAIKGGTMLTNMPSWPENLRIYGTGSNTYFNTIVGSLCYESLLQMNPHTGEFVPSLASHWKISEDKMTFTFRINPKAHWSDGTPVTAGDILATYKLIEDEKLLDPASREAIVAKMEQPIAKSKYIVEVKSKEKDWRNFIAIAGMTILPNHEIGAIGGEEYLEKYNFSYTASSGPYAVHAEDIKDNESLTITRRDDYWGNDEKSNEGLYNFDKIRFVVIRDQRLSFDKACKGELDFYVVYTAKWWKEDLDNLEPIEKGQLIKQKIFTKYPSGIQGLAFNMRKPPLDDVRVRKAIGHLYDRRRMLEKFAYNEYDPLKSYYPGSDYANPNNQMVEFAPQTAAKLLTAAGWTKRGTDGILVKDGKRMSFALSYRTKGLEKYFTSLKEDCKKAGVELNLKLMTGETQWKNTQERNFEISSQAWGGSLFPYPKSSFHSKMADQEGSTNITGLKNKEADKLIEEYDREFDQQKRAVLLKKLDAIVFNEHPYALAWYLPCERILYWNKFGTPETVLPKLGDFRNVFASWWVDPSKEKKLKAARKSGGSMTPIPAEILRPWSEEKAKTASLN